MSKLLITRYSKARDEEVMIWIGNSRLEAMDVLDGKTKSSLGTEYKLWKLDSYHYRNAAPLQSVSVGQTEI